MRGTALVTLSLMGVACGNTAVPPAGPGPAAEACWRGQGESPSPGLPRFPLEQELRVLEEGVTEWEEVPLGDAPAVALQVLPPPGVAACVQLDTVEDLEGRPWVTAPASREDLGSVCRSCPQRVSVAPGAGFYVLPSNDSPPPMPRRLRVRAALRDCETFLPLTPEASGIPSRLSLRALPLLPPPMEQEGVIRLALGFTPGSVFFDEADMGETLEETMRLVNQAFRPGRLRVEVARTRRLPAEGLERLSFAPGDVRELKHVLEMMRTCPEGGSPDALEVPVIFAGCLLEKEGLSQREQRPLGRVTHIPGGFATAEAADGIFLAGSHCDPEGARFEWPATMVARLLAHELGHFLGLYHSVEGDGGQDGLSDTDAANAMHFNPLMSSAQGFSPGQFQVMRRHPLVSYPHTRIDAEFTSECPGRTGSACPRE